MRLWVRCTPSSPAPYPLSPACSTPFPRPLPAQYIELWVPGVAKFPCMFARLPHSHSLALCAPFSTLLLNLLPIIFTFLFQFLRLTCFAISLSRSHLLFPARHAPPLANCCFWLPSQLFSTFLLIFSPPKFIVPHSSDLVTLWKTQSGKIMFKSNVTTDVLGLHVKIFCNRVNHLKLYSFRHLPSPKSHGLIYDYIYNFLTFPIIFYNLPAFCITW